jgi:hypothetical protein
VPQQSSFDYAFIRVVPRVEREEFVNSGVVVFCSEKNFLDSRIYVDEMRLKALWRDLDIDLVRRHLAAIPTICAGDASAGPIAKLSKRERFHWLVAPRSTIIQPSAVHSGLCDDPVAVLDRLFDQLKS